MMGGISTLPCCSQLKAVATASSDWVSTPTTERSSDSVKMCTPILPQVIVPTVSDSNFQRPKYAGRGGQRNHGWVIRSGSRSDRPNSCWRVAESCSGRANSASHEGFFLDKYPVACGQPVHRLWPGGSLTVTLLEDSNDGVYCKNIRDFLVFPDFDIPGQDPIKSILNHKAIAPKNRRVLSRVVKSCRISAVRVKVLAQYVLTAGEIK